MVPHSYTLDSLSKSQDLASTIAAASTPSQIVSTCASIDSFLHSHTPDQSRHFFSLAFPTLICKLFGFDDPSNPNKPPSPAGWIDVAISSNDSDLSAALSSLLSPAGTLSSAISAVDNLPLVKYVFPAERLPEWARFLLISSSSSPAGVASGGPGALSELCPSLFQSRVKESPPSSQIQLNVFEYFLFWFAYYPVCRGKSENSHLVEVKSVKKFRLENWAHSIPVFASAVKRSGSAEQKTESNLYIRILRSYLSAYVPTYDLNAHQPYRSSILHYSGGFDAKVVARAQFLVSTLIHFWLVDNDFSPFPLNDCKFLGVSFRLRSVLGETPPTPGLGEVVKVFVRYLNLSTVAVIEARDGGGASECCGSPRWRNLGSSSSFDAVRAKELASKYNSLRCWNPWAQRPLYRYLLRTFLFCPMAASVKNVSQVFSVWISYLEPWNVTEDELSELEAIANGSASAQVNERKENYVARSRGYTPQWQDYVLSNYLYFSSLVMHFIGFAHRFLHNDVELIIQMVLKVLDMLTTSKELIDLLKNVDTLFHSKQAGPGKPMLNNLYRYVPSIHEQLQDWEDGLCETDADGSFLHENWNKDLRLFAEGEDGGQQLLQLFILRAEAELQAMSGHVSSLQCIDSLKEKLGYLFDGHTMISSPTSPEPIHHQHCRDDIFKPRRAGNHAYVDVKYKGDWMRRPISNDEIAWLAKVLIRLSDWMNESLGLNQAAEGTQVSPAIPYVEITPDVAHVCGPSEALKVFFCAVVSWLFFVGAGCLGLMRRCGLRVNLRVLASKKFVMVLVLYGSFSILKKIVRVLYSM
ncbi:uncharacterized protein LOC107629783 [Arachis ipaensis]|uniref:uncharacterized protein LOC107629783 n=1 Tax=Arachis ipaensis TaxID=130454 RepID=UPI0007AFB230|nr:uncharacterized protein LOC107629783 [Arachis ipaensis]